MQGRDVVFVDADDTLWENMVFFQRVIDEFAMRMARHGVDAARAVATLHSVEDRNIPTTGYGAAPFVRNVVEAFHELVPHADHATRDDVADFAHRAEQGIRDHAIDLLPGVQAAMPALAAQLRVVVLTKGRPDEQASKLERSGLAGFVHALRVVPEKDPACYAEAACAFGLDAARAVMVGNSPRSDVNPALRAGFGAVYVPHPAPWHREMEPLDDAGARLVIVASFADVPAALGRL